MGVGPTTLGGHFLFVHVSSICMRSSCLPCVCVCVRACASVRVRRRSAAGALKCGRTTRPSWLYLRACTARTGQLVLAGNRRVRSAVSQCLGGVFAPSRSH